MLNSSSNPPPCPSPPTHTCVAHPQAQLQQKAAVAEQQFNSNHELVSRLHTMEKDAAELRNEAVRVHVSVGRCEKMWGPLECG